MQFGIYSRERIRWNKSRLDFSRPYLYYGHDHIPGSEEKTSGGIIKCQDLQRLFPNNPLNANILYLISSALPDYPHHLVRLAKRKGVKIVWNQNGVAYPAWHGSGWEETNRPLSYVLKLADHVIFQSDFCKCASDRFLGVYDGPFSILYNPVDTSVFYPAPLIPEGSKIIIAGTHNEWYRVRVALEAFRNLLFQIPEAELFVGGPLRWCNDAQAARNQADEFCEKLSIKRQVRFLGAYSQQNAGDMFRSAHVLLHTQYNDACPRLVVEAMACGLPVVYSSTGGTPELVGSDAGIGVSPYNDWEQIREPDPILLAKALLAIFSNYKDFSYRARQQAVERYDISLWLDAHREIFYSLLP